MKPKALLGLAVAAFVAACSCIVPAAAAISQGRERSCCPAQGSPGEGADCCLRAAPPAPVSAPSAPRSFLAGPANETPRISEASRESAGVAAADLSPPAPVFAAGRSSRAPPAPLA